MRFQSLRQQDLFKHVQLVEFPRVEIVVEFVTNQPMVDKGFLIFVLEKRLDDCLKKLRVFLVDEEVQLVTSVLRIEGSLGR